MRMNSISITASITYMRIVGMALPETLLGGFVLIVLLGATMGGALAAILLLANKSLPIKVDLGILHGRMGVAGVVLLGITFIMGDERNLTVAPALGAYIITVIGGATLYFLIRRKGVFPKIVVLAHGGLAVASLYILAFGFPI